MLLGTSSFWFVWIYHLVDMQGSLQFAGEDYPKVINSQLYTVYQVTIEYTTEDAYNWFYPNLQVQTYITYIDVITVVLGNKDCLFA